MTKQEIINTLREDIAVTKYHIKHTDNLEAIRNLRILLNLLDSTVRDLVNSSMWLR